MTTYKEARSSFHYHLGMWRRDGLRVYANWLSSATQSSCNKLCHDNLLVHILLSPLGNGYSRMLMCHFVSLRQRPHIGRTYWTTTTDNKARIPTMLLAKLVEGRK